MHQIISGPPPKKLKIKAPRKELEEIKIYKEDLLKQKDAQLEEIKGYYEKICGCQGTIDKIEQKMAKADTREQQLLRSDILFEVCGDEIMAADPHELMEAAGSFKTTLKGE